MPQKSKADLSNLLSADRGDLGRRILSKLDQAPADRPPDRRRSPLLVPAVSAALTVTVLVLGFIFLKPSASYDLSGFNPLSEWRNAESTLSSLIADMDSPYRTELGNLMTSVNATADFFRSFLDISLGDEE